MEQKKYISRLTGKETKASQFLTEIAVKRQADKQRKFLSAQFWKDPLWKTVYTQQIAAASRLLRFYSVEEILTALESKEGNWIYSLSFKGLVDIINKYKTVKKIETAKIEEHTIVVDENNITQKPKVLPNKKSTINRLRDLDG